MNSSEVSLDVCNRQGKQRLKIESVYIQPADKFHMPSRPKLQEIGDTEQFPHLKGLEFASVTPDQITILIGGDAPEAHIQHRVRRGKKGQPYGMKTRYGWTLFGTAGRSLVTKKDVQCSTVLVENDVLSPTLP